MLVKRADATSTDNERQAQLHFACKSGDPISLEVIKVLIEAGANLLAHGKEGKNALDLAQANGYKRLVDYLKTF